MAEDYSSCLVCFTQSGVIDLNRNQGIMHILYASVGRARECEQIIISEEEEEAQLVHLIV
jgi:hypothetical protein